MKGKKTFTSSEAQLIKELIEKKVKALSIEQKAIRNKIRKLGFYYSDFSFSKHGYTTEDFDAIVKSGHIEITNLDDSTMISKPNKKL